MPHFKTRHTVGHSADDMFALVADVRAYPEFVPLCQSLRVRGQSELADGQSVIVADMTVAYKVFKEIFTSRVTLNPQAREIVVTYLDGPFKKMENRWRFEPLDGVADAGTNLPSGAGRCVVEFYIDYEFRSRTLASLMGTMFDRAFRKFSTAFEARADSLYGTDANPA